MPLTHLSALTTCQQIGWIDVLEPNPEHVRRIKRNQKIRHCVASLAELKAHADDYTIACIATPGDTHFSMLEALNRSAINIGHVLCEKPLFSAAAKFHAQASEIKQMKFPVTVNYPRTWSIDNTSLLDLAAKYELGACTSVVASYGKGLKNNGSHMINLLLNLFGEPQRSRQSESTAPMNCATTQRSLSGYSSTVTRSLSWLPRHNLFRCLSSIFGSSGADSTERWRTDDRVPHTGRRPGLPGIQDPWASYDETDRPRWLDAGSD